MPGCWTAPIGLRFDSPARGDPEPIDIEETETHFTIDWKGHYRIDGDAFLYTDRGSGRVVAILGYPTTKIARLG